MTAGSFAVRLVQAKLPTKVDLDDFVNEIDFDNKLKTINKKVNTNKAKHVLVET